MIWVLQRLSLLALTAVLVFGCSSRKTFAPVVDVSGYEAVPRNGSYKVTAGDTLYSIAWRYGIDYRVLAENNNLDEPYTITSGQKLYLRGNKSASGRLKQLARSGEEGAASVDQTREPDFKIKSWKWPTRGKVVSGFSKSNNGIKIRGYYGDSVYAAAPGKVVYAGSGLRGYGNLVIIKHNNQYLSAYALNKRLYVKEGQWVDGGQKIAQVGEDVANRPSLHFEIRRAGEPVNPLKLLKS